MNKSQYEQLRKQAQSLIFRFKDLCDDRSHELARSIDRSLQKIEDELQTYKNPRSIEATVHNLERTFSAWEHEQVMDFRHASYFEDQMRGLKVSLRQFENY